MFIARPVLHGMVSGTATAKLTITLDDRKLEEIRALVADGQAASISGFVKHAVGVALFDAAGWRERRWADALLSKPRPNRRPKKGRAA